MSPHSLVTLRLIMCQLDDELLMPETLTDEPKEVTVKPAELGRVDQEWFEKLPETENQASSPKTVVGPEMLGKLPALLTVLVVELISFPLDP